MDQETENQVQQNHNGEGMKKNLVVTPEVAWISEWTAVNDAQRGVYCKIAELQQILTQRYTM